MTNCGNPESVNIEILSVEAAVIATCGLPFADPHPPVLKAKFIP
jgi:hypothetical protein